MSTLDTNAKTRHQPTNGDPHPSVLLEEAVSTLRRAIEAPRWDAQLVQVEVSLPLLTHAALPSLLDALSEEDAVYWSTPDGETRVGLGAVRVIEGSGDSRFVTVREAARALPSWARLFAGFSFRAGDRDFGDARAVLPRFLIRRFDTGCTLSVWFDRDHHDERVRSGLRDALDRLASCWRTPVLASAPVAVAKLEESAEECDRFVALVAHARAQIRSGALEKVTVHRQTRTDTGDARAVSQVLRNLDHAQQTSTRFAFRVRGITFLGATPERLVRRQGLHIASDVLAGSLPRTLGTETAASLLASDKDRSEHELTRSAISDLLRVRCVELTEDGPQVRALPNLFHLFTAIDGVLRGDDHVLDLVETLHPTPAVGGSPRSAALAYIAENERDDRGWYAGPIGWFTPDGDGDFCVALRCARVEGTALTLYAGAGIVADSDPMTELAETRSKRRAIAGALDLDLTK